ncbi:MAG: GntR family transcriptional regulator [Alphaproteobacteria bacterium]|nr:MAG: GntR family transcriptional regulator [Alphaproteobacteria bacterium]
MPQLYQMNLLTIIEVGKDGVFLEGDDEGDIHLVDAPDNLHEGEEIEVFIYRNTSDNVVATVAPAYVRVGECANLEVVSAGDNGAFLDWGLPKDLFLPHKEQAYYVDEGDYCVVHVYLDKKGRPAASSLLYHHLDEYQGDLEVGQQVDLLIADDNDLGFKAVINHEQLGLIYHSELSQPLQLGTRMKGWVKGIRDDGKINLNINAFDTDTRDELEAQILAQLKQENGRIDISDKSPPDEIFKAFKVSKKNFKRAIGSLYKQRLIKIDPKFIALVEEA